MSCISFLIRGSIKDKIELGFYINDRNDKNYLSKKEFGNFLESITKSSIIAIDNVVKAEFQKESL